MFLHISLNELENFIKTTDKGLSCEISGNDYHELVQVMGYIQAQNERQPLYDQMFEPLQKIIDILKTYNQDIPANVYVQMEVRDIYTTFIDKTILS